MDTSSYVAVSGQLALDRRLTAIANNVANAGTVGFRAEGMKFSTIVSKTEPFRTNFVSEGASHADLSSGGFTKTGNPFDVAIQGKSFLSILTPQGIGYTRDGRMQMLANGDLVSLNGYPVLDSSGSPLSIDPNGGAVEISRDGMIRQSGRAAGALGLFEVDLSKGYARFENAAFFPKAQPQPVEDFTGNGLVQGFVEDSNVNPVMEMTRLISVQRIFEAVSNLIEQRDSAQRETIQTLGGKGG